MCGRSSLEMLQRETAARIGAFSQQMVRRCAGVAEDNWSGFPQSALRSRLRVPKKTSNFLFRIVSSRCLA